MKKLNKITPFIIAAPVLCDRSNTSLSTESTITTEPTIPTVSFSYTAVIDPSRNLKCISDENHTLGGAKIRDIITGTFSYTLTNDFTESSGSIALRRYITRGSLTANIGNTTLEFLSVQVRIIVSKNNISFSILDDDPRFLEIGFSLEDLSASGFGDLSLPQSLDRFRGCPS